MRQWLSACLRDSAWCGISVTAWGFLTEQCTLECLLFTSRFLKWPVFLFLQTTLGTRVTFAGKNINIIAASKSTETCMPWMVSTILTFRHLN